jgi:hypothetical protein
MYEFYLPGLEKLITYEKESYVLVENKFSRQRKMVFKDFVYYILLNKGKSSVLEIDEYFKERFGGDVMPISKQDLSQQRLLLSPLIFKDADKIALKEIYSGNQWELEKFKDYHVFNVDGSQFNIPNTPITREKFEVELRALKETESPKARVSVISDAKNEFIIDSIISPSHTGENSLAFKNIENASKIINLEKAIVVFDRAYASTELFLQLIEKNSKFIFRLKNSDYKKERKHMKTHDEFVEIKLNSSRTQNIKNKQLKEKAEKITHLNLRILNIPLETGEIETLITNLPPKTANPLELKTLYGERWQIETGYNVLKNKLHIENFSGKKRITIEQDFYAQIHMYNILISAKIEFNKKIQTENKNCQCKYKININLLAGKLKNNLFEIIFTENPKKRKKLWKNIHKTIKRNLRKVKKKPPTPRKTKKPKRKYPYNNRKNF